MVSLILVTVRGLYSQENVRTIIGSGMDYVNSVKR